MDQLACLPVNQLGISTGNISDLNNHGMRGLDYANANENMAWADIRRSKKKLVKLLNINIYLCYDLNIVPTLLISFVLFLI